jgi:NADH dehydrogenase
MDLHAYQLIGKAVVEGKRVVLFGKGQNPRNFVAAEDVAKAISGILEIPAMRGQTIDMGGPENLSGHQVVEVFERISGRKAKVTHVPLPVLKAMSKAIKPLHPGISRVIQSGVLSETTDQKFDPSQFRTRIPITLTTLDEWAKARTSA